MLGLRHHHEALLGIAFGQAVAKAVGDKRGLRRYGHAYVPLDEALSRVVVDLSGTRLVDHTVMEKLHALEREFEDRGGRLHVTGLDGHRPLSRHPYAARKKVPAGGGDGEPVGAGSGR